MNITITSWFEIEVADGDQRKLKVDTTGNLKICPLKTVLDIHNEKVGAIERKLLKDYAMDTI